MLPSLSSRPATRTEQPHHRHHATEPNGAQESPRRVFKPDRKTVVPSCNALSIYWRDGQVELAWVVWDEKLR